MPVFIDKDGRLSVGPRVLCDLSLKVFLVDGFVEGAGEENEKDSRAVRENLRKYLTSHLEEAIVKWNVQRGADALGTVELRDCSWAAYRERMGTDEKGEPTVRTHRV